MAAIAGNGRLGRRRRLWRRLAASLAAAAAVAGTALAVLAIAQEGQARQWRGAAYRPVPRDAAAFWGHGCFCIDMAGTAVVTDPVFESYAPGARRLVPRPDRGLLRDVRAVLISHAHLDHLSRRTLAEFPRETVLVCPPPCARYLAGLPNEVRVLQSWEETAVHGVTVTAVPARHPGGRYVLKPGKGGPAVGYVLRGSGRTVYYSGDTEYFDGLAAIGERYRPDVALLNVNVHLPYPQAAWAARDLGAGVVIPGHHGAFYTPRALAGGGWRSRLADDLGSQFRVLPLGESLPLPGADRE